MTCSLGARGAPMFDRYEVPRGASFGVERFRAASRWSVLSLVVIAGCGSQAAHGTDESKKDAPIPACDAYVAAMRRCVGASGPKALAAGEARFAAMKASFKAGTDEERTALGERCTARLKIVTGACR